jgi:hypothetical protein
MSVAAVQVRVALVQVCVAPRTVSVTLRPVSVTLCPGGVAPNPVGVAPRPVSVAPCTVRVASRTVSGALRPSRAALSEVAVVLFLPRVSPSELGAATSTRADPWRRGRRVVRTTRARRRERAFVEPASGRARAASARASTPSPAGGTNARDRSQRTIGRPNVQVLPFASLEGRPVACARGQALRSGRQRTRRPGKARPSSRAKKTLGISFRAHAVSTRGLSG